ncbi:hypothetical protein BT93_B0699 [Corymbia citriodora subsp. variegata]|nr:hypothetical protein BT93_B0699 [Corymbia citriodora subsp. variegata]
MSDPSQLISEEPSSRFWMRNMKHVEGSSTVEDIRCVESPVSFLSNLSLDETYKEGGMTIKGSS